MEVTIELERLLPLLPPLAVLLSGIIIISLSWRILLRKKNSIFPDNYLVKQLLFFIICALVFLAFIVSLPINNDLKRQIVSLFGIAATAVVAMSSTSFLGNAMAGFMLRFIDTIEPGDYIKVSDYEGRVSDQRLLYTEIQTEDSRLVTIPNLLLINNPTTVVRESGTIISTQVSLGYDVPRARVEEHLLKAASSASLENPFVHVLQLGDFSVTYKVAGFRTNTKQLLTAYSHLRSCVLDSLHKARIEIVSPTFMNQRRIEDGHVFIPASIIPQDESSASQQAEQKIFDKAHDAESKDKVSDLIALTEAELEGLKKAAKEKGANSEKAAEDIKRCEAKLERLKGNLNALSAELGAKLDDK